MLFLPNTNVSSSNCFAFFSNAMCSIPIDIITFHFDFRLSNKLFVSNTLTWLLADCDHDDVRSQLMIESTDC